MIKKYIGVDANNIRLVMHAYGDRLYGKKVYPKPKLMTFTIGNAVELFDKNGIPEEYQKMFMKVNNNLSMLIQDIRDHSINLYAAKLNRFKVREYIIGTEVFIAYNERHALFGEQATFPCAFHVSDCYLCDEEEVEDFMINLREKGLFDNYIKSLAELTHIKVCSEYDSNKIDEEKGRELVKK